MGFIMPDHYFWLSEAQFAQLQPLLPNKVRGVPRVDDRKVISGIIHVIRYGLMWRDAPTCYGPRKTLYNRFVRWSKGGVFDRIFQALAADSTATETVDRQHAPQGASHRCQPAQKGAFPRHIGRTRGGLNSKLHAVCDGEGKPLMLLLTAGQVSDYRGADTVLPTLPDADIPIANEGYDSNRLRKALAERTSSLVFRAAPTAKNRLPTTPNFTRTAISLSACLADSKIGAASPSDMIAVRTPSTAPSVLLPRLSSGYES